MTVSLALRNHPRIPAETRDRVREVADRVGYRPNALLRALSAGIRKGPPADRSPVLSFINPFRDLDEWNARPRLRKFFEGARARAERLGYTLDPFWLGEPRMNAARVGQILEARGILGVVLGGLPTARGHLSLRLDKFAVAAQGYSVVRPALHRSCHHHADGMAQALRQGRKLGAKRIGLALTTERSARVNQLWLGQYAAAHLLSSARRRVTPCLAPTLSKSHIRTWLEKARPDFVLTAHSDVCHWIAEWSRRTGTDCGFAHLDLHPELFPGWHGIDQDQQAVGARAVELVVEQLHRNQFGIPPRPKIVLTAGRWVQAEKA